MFNMLEEDHFYFKMEKIYGLKYYLKIQKTLLIKNRKKYFVKKIQKSTIVRYMYVFFKLYFYFLKICDAMYTWNEYSYNERLNKMPFCFFFL